MRLDVNLATQPFEDAQQFVRRWLTLLAVLVIATVGLIWYCGHTYLRSRSIRKQVVQVQDEIRNLGREDQHARSVLARVENRGTVERSEFLNAVFARKAFSWTTVFSDMEKIMPYGLYVVSITPSLAANNELHVTIAVAGSSRESAVELVRSMEQVPRFRDVTLVSETLPSPDVRAGSNPAESLVQYNITALYQPKLPGASPAEPEGKAKPQTAELGAKRR